MAYKNNVPLQMMQYISFDKSSTLDSDSAIYAQVSDIISLAYMHIQSYGAMIVRVFDLHPA